MFLKLHDYETGKAVRVHPDAIRSMRRLEAITPGGRWGRISLQEEDERTRIDTATDCILVRETVEEIERMIESAGQKEGS